MTTATIALAKVKEGKPMGVTHERLLALLTQRGQAHLADLLGIGPTEIHRKVMGETGFTLRQFAQIFDDLEICVAGPNDVVIDRGKHEALTRIAADALHSQVESFDLRVDRRKDQER